MRSIIGFMHVLLTSLRSRSNGWSNFKSQSSHMALFDSSDLPKERLRFGGLMGGSGRPKYKDSDPTTCFTNHYHVAQLWPLNRERLRFNQNCQLSHALISIVSSFHHPISARSTGKVNFFYTSPILSRSWLILRFSDLRNLNLTFVYLFGASNYVKLIFYLINT